VPQSFYPAPHAFGTIRQRLSDLTSTTRSIGKVNMHAKITPGGGIRVESHDCQHMPAGSHKHRQVVFASDGANQRRGPSRGRRRKACLRYPLQIRMRAKVTVAPAGISNERQSWQACWS